MKKLTFILCFYTINLFAQVPGYVPTTGLIGYWPLDGNANDVSVNGNNGVNVGTTPSTDRYGNLNSCLYFDNDYVEMLNISMNLQSDFTFSYWQKLNSYNHAAVIVDLNQNKNCSQTPHIWQYLDSVRLGMCGTANGSKSLGSKGSLINTWIHFLFTSSGGVTNIFKNGILVSNLNHTWPITSTVQFTLGNGGNNSAVLHGQPSDIYIDDVGLWNRTLSQSEITTLYQGFATSIAQINVDKDYEIYPNPITNVFNVKIPQDLKNEVYKITDLSGKILKSDVLKNGVNLIDIAMLSPGVYFIVFGKENLITKKILKN